MIVVQESSLAAFCVHTWHNAELVLGGGRALCSLVVDPGRLLYAQLLSSGTFVPGIDVNGKLDFPSHEQ